MNFAKWDAGIPNHQQIPQLQITNDSKRTIVQHKLQKKPIVRAAQLLLGMCSTSKHQDS